jgi:BlaI family transcriptional regulator, penicillinase repressor
MDRAEMRMTEQPMLPDAELEVLACLWTHGPLAARQIRETMAEYRPMSHSAVSTLLKRLQDKGLITRRKSGVGKAFLFEAAVQPQGTYRQVAQQMLQRVFGGDPLNLVASLFQGRPPTAEELDRLQQLLDELRRTKNRKGTRR